MSLGTGASGGDKKIIISRVVVLSEEPVDNRTIAENVWMSFGFSPARHSPVTAGHIGREGRRTHTHTERERACHRFPSEKEWSERGWRWKK